MEGDTARRLALLGLCLGLLLLAPSHLASAAAVEDGLLSNGDFETAPAGGFVKSASVAEGASSIPGWTINGTVELISAGQHQGGMILIVPQDNVVSNGDFEEGPWMFPNTSFGVLLPTNLDEQTSALPGWMIESNRAVRFVDSDQYTVPQGKRAIELLSGKEGIISQMVETTPQKEYSLTFTLGSAGDSCQPPMAVMAFAGDQAQNFHYSPMGNATSQAANVTFTARAERTRVVFYSVYYNTRSDDHSSLCGPVIDDVRVWGLNGAAGLKASIGLLLGIVSIKVTCHCGKCVVVVMMRHVFDQNGIKGAIAAVAKLPDNAVQADVVSTLKRKLDLFNLDIFLSFLPVLAGLLTSKAERHAIVSLELLLDLIKIFGPVIRSTLSAHSAVGVDIQAEQRRGGQSAQLAQELNLSLQDLVVI
ncbi:hypothetical protein OsI_02272 [Oryza sativa Indica Group]|uniref:DUF642 domain-containing protein n=1 Tax=Oryza sativa subsp. indica TaxID=39946 RepID=B8A9M9_ORYSI|nr:hypothetical protein OsI_02272 [Oryza sativa Indica Group]